MTAKRSVLKVSTRGYLPVVRSTSDSGENRNWNSGVKEGARETICKENVGGGERNSWQTISSLKI